jgi:hypothetical protein
MLKKPKAQNSATLESELNNEYRYASHHHLIPLYILSAVALLGFIVLTCFVMIFWQNTERDSYRPTVESTITSAENSYIPTTISPTEKKQYIYSANIKFPINNPYDTFRYAYDTGQNLTPTSPSITLTTTRTLQSLETALRSDPAKVNSRSARFQECARLYTIRFVGGSSMYGGFTPLKDIKLKDGRTAYIQKNMSCVPDSVQAMNELDMIEKDISAIESF